MIIADTCLIFHLYNKTHLTASAQEILNIENHWIVPTLWREEYANILSKLVRKGSHSIKEAVHLFNTSVDDLSNYEINVDTCKALELAIAYKISVYDAHFVALAIDLGIFLVTEDKEVLKRCSDYALSMDHFINRMGPEKHL